MTGFNTLAEVSAELDRLDAQLGDMMKGFDEKQSEREFNTLLEKCNALVDEMTALYKLESQLKRERVPA